MLTRGQQFILLFGLGAAAFGVSLGVATMVAPQELAEAASTDWSYVESTRGELRALAIQGCTLTRSQNEAGLQELTAEYEAMATRYESAVRGRMTAGLQRPSDVPVLAPELESTMERLCLDTPGGATPTPTAAPFVDSGADRLSWDELDAAAREAGWPDEPGWWPEMRLIVQCESGRNRFAHNRQDPNGGSYGLAQLNGTQHFDRSGEDFEMRFDPVVNLRTALWLRTVRGHFGGSGGWKICAERHGIR